MSRSIGASVCLTMVAAAIACGDRESHGAWFDSDDATAGSSSTSVAASSASTSTSGGEGSGDSDSAATGQSTGAAETTAGLKLDVAAEDTGPPPACIEGQRCGCTAVDLLFVIDNSESMAQYQAALAQAFPTFADAIIAALPPATSLHVGVTSTTMGMSTLGITMGCTGIGELAQPQEAYYEPPTMGDNGINGAQGRLYVAENKAFFEIATDAPPEEVDALSTWFAKAANIGENGSQIEMAAAGAGWVADAANDDVNAGFIRDEDAVLVLFFVQDEPDQSDAPGLTTQQTGEAMLDKVLAAKSTCGGAQCIVGGGFVDTACLDQTALGPLLGGLGKPAIVDVLPPADQVTPETFTPLLEDTLAQVIAEVCEEIGPEG